VPTTKQEVLAALVQAMADRLAEGARDDAERLHQQMEEPVLSELVERLNAEEGDDARPFDDGPEVRRAERFCQTGPNAGKPGPCPGPGEAAASSAKLSPEGRKAERKEQQRQEKLQHRQRHAAKWRQDREAHVSQINQIHGKQVLTTERPADPEFHDPHRREVEEQVQDLLEANPSAATSDLVFAPEHGQTRVFGGGGHTATPVAFITREENGEIALTENLSIGGRPRSELIAPTDPPDLREYKVRRVLRLPMPPELKEKYGPPA
jgi:hypothetical protein